MSKFLLLLVVIFILFVIGGTYLLESGIVANGHVDKLPLAVATEDFLTALWTTLTNWAGQIYPSVKPVTDLVIKIISPIINLATAPNT